MPMLEINWPDVDSDQTNYVVLQWTLTFIFTDDIGLRMVPEGLGLSSYFIGPAYRLLTVQGRGNDFFLGGGGQRC